MRHLTYPALVFLFALGAASCRTDKPPSISIICIGDGFGGCDGSIPVGGSFPDGCVIKDPAKPTQVYCPPSALKNMWMTTQQDEANFAGWCYKTTPARADRTLERIKSRIVAARDPADLQGGTNEE